MNDFLKNIIDTFTKSDDVQEFAILVGLEEDPYIKLRIFQLQCQELFKLIEEDVPIPSPEPMILPRYSNQNKQQQRII